MVTFCSISGRVFSYTKQVKFCTKFGDFLLHFWEGFFLCYTGKSLHKIWWLFAPYLGGATQVLHFWEGLDFETFWTKSANAKTYWTTLISSLIKQMRILKIKQQILRWIVIILHTKTIWKLNILNKNLPTNCFLSIHFERF